MNKLGCPKPLEAEGLLSWGGENNPGRWVGHSKNVAMAAKKIAAFCNLDVDKAYSLALLHDIGRYEGFGGCIILLQGIS